MFAFPPHKENKGNGKGKRTKKGRHSPKANPTSIDHRGAPGACPCVFPQTGANPKSSPTQAYAPRRRKPEAVTGGRGERKRERGEAGEGGETEPPEPEQYRPPC